MVKMSRRERVARAIRGDEVDRVPLYDILMNDAVIEYYSGQKLTVENGAKLKAAAISRCLDMTRMVGGPSAPAHIVGGDGHEWQIERWTSWVSKRPYNDVDGLAEWVKNQVVSLNSSASVDGAAVKSTVDMVNNFYAECMNSVADASELPMFVLESGVGLTETYALCGLQLFSELCADEPELVDDWLEARNQAQIKWVHALAPTGTIEVALTYDDIAAKGGPIFNPKWLREHFFFRLKRLVEAWHQYGVTCLFHSDGDLTPILADLADTGIDGINPIETCAGMSIEEVRRLQPQLFMAGGIDVSQLLPLGSADEVRICCKKAIEATNGRRYFMGSTTELHDAVPLENARAMYELQWDSSEGR